MDYSLLLCIEKKKLSENPLAGSGRGTIKNLFGI
jgi:hypothetical protein